MDRSFAERLLEELVAAAVDVGELGPNKLPGLGIAATRLKRATEDVRQAMLVPDLKEVDFVTPRDEFATAALTGLLQNGGRYGHIDAQGDEKMFADLAWTYADAMMAARKGGA